MSNLNPDKNIHEEDVESTAAEEHQINKIGEVRTCNNIPNTETTTFDYNDIPPPVAPAPLDINALQLLWQANQFNPLNLANSFQTLPFAPVPTPMAKQRPIIPGYLEIITESDAIPCQCLFHSNITAPIPLTISTQSSIGSNHTLDADTISIPSKRKSSSAIVCNCQGHCQNARCRCFQVGRPCCDECTCKIPQYGPCKNPVHSSFSKKIYSPPGRCNCKRNELNCTKAYCSCKRQNVACTDLCGCFNCHNPHNAKKNQSS